MLTYIMKGGHFMSPVKTVLWFLSGISVLLVVFGFTVADTMGKLVGMAYGGLIASVFVPFLAACYVRPQPWFAVLLTTLFMVGILYANAWACRSAGTRYIHLSDHAFLLLFCIPGAVTFLVRWSKTAGE